MNCKYEYVSQTKGHCCCYNSTDRQAHTPISGAVMDLDGGPTPKAFTAQTRYSLSVLDSSRSTESEQVGTGVVLILFHDDSMYLST